MIIAEARIPVAGPSITDREVELAAKAARTDSDETYLYPTVFHEDWWLKAATDDGYAVAEVIDNGRTVGRLPYSLRNRFGAPWRSMPPLTPFLGPAIGFVERKSIAQNNRLGNAICRNLILQLPSARFIQVKCHRNVRTVLAFQEQRFRTTVQFTYEILPAPEKTLWQNIRASRRNQIKKAQEQLEVFDLDDPDAFLGFYHKNLEAKKVFNRLDMAAAYRLITESRRRGRGRIIAAKHCDGSIQAGIFYVWDATSAYYLMTSRAPSSPHGSTSLLIWEAIKRTTQRGLIFDFGGLGTVGSIQIYSDFGGASAPRYVATKATLPIALAYTIRAGIGLDPYLF